LEGPQREREREKEKGGAEKKEHKEEKRSNKYYQVRVNSWAKEE